MVWDGKNYHCKAKYYFSHNFKPNNIIKESYIDNTKEDITKNENKNKNENKREEKIK